MKPLLILLLLSALVLTGCAGQSDELPAVSVPTESGTLWDVANPQSAPDNSATAQETPITAPDAEDVVYINERLFIAQTNDIYLNTPDYLGKTIQYEGLFKKAAWEDSTYCYVIRYGPGCCGYDGEAGFEVAWDGPWPRVDDWCEVVGVLEEYQENGMTYLRLALTSLTVLEQRGAEFVSQ